MDEQKHIVINIIHPRNGRKYRRGDDMIEKYVINVGETVDIDASLSFCIGKSQVERTVKHNFGTKHHIDREELSAIITDIEDNYQPYDRTTALMAPEHYNKVLISVGNVEYLLERMETQTAILMKAIDRIAIRSVLLKEKLEYFKHGPTTYKYYPLPMLIQQIKTK